MANLENKNFSYDEMMVHVPMCSHKNINSILVVGEVSEDFKAELNKHECRNVTFSDSLNIEGSFDIILYNNGVPDALGLANIERVIEPEKGIFCCNATFIYKDLELAKKELATVAKNFWIAMPYTFGHNTIIFASKKYHPQAEIVLQVSDLLPGCNYYNTELHNAVFIYPQYITKAITGIAKR